MLGPPIGERNIYLSIGRCQETAGDPYTGRLGTTTAPRPMTRKDPQASTGSRSCIALLRAVNVGGRSVAMAELRAMLTDLGYVNPRTLLQSGNAVFAIKAKTSIAALETK